MMKGVEAPPDRNGPTRGELLLALLVFSAALAAALTVFRP
jgi:hypothetical protein